MTVTLAPRINPSPRPVAGQPPCRSGSNDARTESLQQEALRHDLAARAAAERGDMAASARAILAFLDCERRLRGTGPQVIQVIKPRS